MNEQTIFDINRVKLLLTRQLRLNSSTILIGFGAVVGVITFILSIRIITESNALSMAGFTGLALPIFFIGGYIFTSTIFSELRTSHRGYLYLTLPASTLEKLVVAWFISSVLYIIAAIVVFYFINLLLMLVAFLTNGEPVQLFNFFDPWMLKIYAIYIVTQSVFLLGAIYFRGVNFLKTLLTLFVISLVLSIFSAILTRLIVFPGFGNFQFSNNMPDGIEGFIGDVFVPTVKILFWYVMAPFFLVVSYYRLKERQV